jgi:hypothetical protein
VTDHGLLMSGPMALAAYRGIKTQTRRPLKVPGAQHCDLELTHQPNVRTAKASFVWRKNPSKDSPYVDARCPYGRVGDIVYVRETFRTLGHGRRFGVEINYAADGSDFQACRAFGFNRVLDECPDRDDRWRLLNIGKWHPSIHMPKWAARTWGRITDVRVQRVQDITEDDAIAEGMRPFFEVYESIGFDQRITTGELCADDPHRASFAVLWDELYGTSSDMFWVSNPWVWAITWERIDRA